MPLPPLPLLLIIISKLAIPAAPDAGCFFVLLVSSSWAAFLGLELAGISVVESCKSGELVHLLSSVSLSFIDILDVAVLLLITDCLYFFATI